MKAILLLLLMPVMALADPLPGWPLLRLNNGTEYREVRVTAVEAGGLKVVHAGGVARVPEAQLPPEVRALFIFDPVRAADEAREREAKDQAARAMVADTLKQQQARDAEVAARAKLKYRFMSFRFTKAVPGGCLGYRHEKNGVVGEAGLVTRALVDRPLRPPQQSAYNEGGTDYERPVFIEGVGDFAAGEIIGGFVAELGAVEHDGRTVRRWVLQPGKSLRRN